MRRSAKKRSLLGRFLLWSVLVVIVGLLGVGWYGYSWIQDYMKSDAFRMQLASQLGRAARADAILETLTWSGPEVHVTQASLNSKRDQAWKSIHAGGIQASVDFGAARDGVWHITRINADTLRMDMRSAAEIPLNLPDELEEPQRSSIPGWLRRWIPTRTKIDEVQVQTFDFLPPAGAPGVSATGVTVVGKPANDQGAWQLRGEGGRLALPGLTEPFRLTSVSTRLDAKAIVFHEATARWLGDSEVTARGDVPFEPGKPWSFNGSVANLDLKHLLSANWNAHMGGVLEGEFESGPAANKARIRVKNGVVHSLPSQHLVATFTRVDRFRRIIFDVASADVERTAAATKVSNLKLQSAGLMQVEGGFVVHNDTQVIDGNLLVGVAPDTLNWILGSGDRVFTQRREDAPGYLWTNVRISGVVGDVREDLTNRVRIAMGLEPLEMLEKGVGVLTGTGGALGGTAVGVSKEVLNTGKDIIKGTGEAAGSVLQKGTEIIKDMVPIFGR